MKRFNKSLVFLTSCLASLGVFALRVNRGVKDLNLFLTDSYFGDFFESFCRLRSAHPAIFF